MEFREWKQDENGMSEVVALGFKPLSEMGPGNSSKVGINLESEEQFQNVSLGGWLVIAFGEGL